MKKKVKKELKYKVSDFWVYQKTFEKILHDANLNHMSVNEWLIHAVEDKLFQDEIKRNSEMIMMKQPSLDIKKPPSLKEFGGMGESF